MPLVTIEGFLLDSEQLAAAYGSQSLNATLLIEVDSPLRDATYVQSVLPAFGSQAEPTFTIGKSYYPGRTDLILKAAPSVREHEAGRPFWLVDLQYASDDWLNQTLEGENQGRGKVGLKKRIDSVTGNIIVDPTDEPPTWSSSTRTVQATRWHSADGKLLRHTNNLPVTEGITHQKVLEVHTFTWNVDYDTFDYDTAVKPYIGKINNSTVTNLKNGQKWHVHCESITCTENYRTVNLGTPSGQTGGQGTFHYITLVANFVIDRRTYDASVAADDQYGYFRESMRRVSMHTRAYPRNSAGVVVKGKGHSDIDVNDEGTIATSPWPLDPYGAAIQYRATFPALPTIATADPLTDYGWIDTGLPEEADLNTFVTTHNLVIP
jgi:hypothetical protein